MIEKGATAFDKLCHKLFAGNGNGTDFLSKETGVKCGCCGRDLNAYYCESSLFLIECHCCKKKALVMAKNAKEAAYNAFGYEASRAEVHQHGENCTHISNCETLNKRMLSEEPKCPICGDRGYVGSAMCDCFRKFCVLEQNRELTRLMATGNESFENFNLNYYPDISLDYFYATTEDSRQQPSLSKATIRHGIKRYPTYISIYEILHCSIERVSAVFNNASYSIMLLLRKS